MKAKIWKALLAMLACVTLCIGITACFDDENSSSSSRVVTSDETSEVNSSDEDISLDKIIFKTLTVDGDTAYGKVSNATTEFSFVDEIETRGKSKFSVSLDIYGQNVVIWKTIPLEIGDNTVYVTETIDGEPVKLYTVTIRRRPTYTVTFDVKVGKRIESQTLDEDSLVTNPGELTCAGYTFMSWDYDFSQPITKDTKITALWQVHTDTKYTVNHYLENLENDEYTLEETEILSGETDTIAKAQIKEYEHFTCDSWISTISGKINGEGDRVLSVYYKRNRYRLSQKNASGLITNMGSYKYGTKAITTIATPDLGYSVAWYSGEELLSTDLEYTFTVERNVTAQFEQKEEMLPFEFTSTENTCTVMGLKDENVTDIILPDYVTSIGDKAFYNCSNLNSITLSNDIISIGEDAFYGCDSLTYTEYGNCKYLGDEDNPYIALIKPINTSQSFYTIHDKTKIVADWTFKGCSRVESITVPDSVISIGDASFRSCASLSSVEVGNGVTSIGDGAFSYCSSLTHVVFGCFCVLNHNSSRFVVGIVESKCR